MDVAPNAPQSVTNRAIVVGRSGVISANNTTTDTATVDRGPDLTIVKPPNSFAPGQKGVIFIIAVANRGGGPTEGTVRVTDELPEELTATAAQAQAGTAKSQARPGLSWSDVLAAGVSYPNITITTDVADVPVGSTIINIAQVSHQADVNRGNNTAEDSETLLQRPDLTLTKTHSATFTRGQTGAIYTLVVTNSGQEATSGQVKVEDRVPAGLKPTAAAGSGWTCTIGGQTVSCVRSDPLAPGSSYPAILLTVTVAPDAAPSITNTATVSGGGDDASDSVSDVTTIESAGPYTFSHITVGGGYLAGLVISNTGAETATGDLIFTDQNGGPFQVSLTESSTTSAQSSSSLRPWISSALHFRILCPSGRNQDSPGCSARSFGPASGRLGSPGLVDRLPDRLRFLRIHAARRPRPGEHGGCIRRLSNQRGYDHGGQ